MPAPKKVNVKDKKQVIDAIERLTARLRKERREQSRLRARIAKNHAQIQKLHAWRLTRKRQLAKLQFSGQRRVVEGALRWVGTTEQPPGSNKGPTIISKCQIEIIGYDGVAWCGCFAGWHAENLAGVGAIGARVAYCPFIDADSKAKTNGFVGQVPLGEGRPGDFAVFDWEKDGVEDHVGIIVENLGSGWYRVVEGNTSFDYTGGAAAQSNGGCVALKKRHSSTFGCIARPAYA